jgi:hypothetical protein
MKYAISATVNFKDDELDTPVMGGLDIDDIGLWIAKLLAHGTIGKAISYTVTIIPDKEPHENVI